MKKERQKLDDRYRKFWGYNIEEAISSPEEVLLFGIYEELKKLNKVGKLK